MDEIKGAGTTNQIHFGSCTFSFIIQNDININEYILESYFAHNKIKDKDVWDL